MEPMDEALDFFREHFPAERIYRILRHESRQLGEGTPALELPPEERAATRGPARNLGDARTHWARYVARYPEVAELRGLEALQELLGAFSQALSLPSPRTPLEEEIRQAYRFGLQQIVEVFDVPPSDPFGFVGGIIEDRLKELLQRLVWRRRALERGVPEAWVWGWPDWDWIQITLAQRSRDRLRALGLEEYLQQPPEAWAVRLEGAYPHRAWLVPWYYDDYHEVFFRRLSGEPELLPPPESYLPPEPPSREPSPEYEAYPLYTEEGALRFFRDQYPAETIYQILRNEVRNMDEGDPLPFRPEWAQLGGYEAFAAIYPAFCQALGLPAPDRAFFERTRRFLSDLDMVGPYPPTSFYTEMLFHKMQGFLERAIWQRRALEFGVPEAWQVSDWESLELALMTRDRLVALGLEAYTQQPPRAWAPLLDDDEEDPVYLIPYHSEEAYEQFFRRFSGVQA